MNISANARSSGDSLQNTVVSKAPRISVPHAGHRTGRGWGISSTGIFDRMENPTGEEIDAVINIVPRFAAMMLPLFEAILDNANKTAAGASLTEREDVGRSKGGSD